MTGFRWTPEEAFEYTKALEAENDHLLADCRALNEELRIARELTCHHGESCHAADARIQELETALEKINEQCVDDGNAHINAIYEICRATKSEQGSPE